MSTGLTTRYSLPFPYGDDPVANGDDMIQRLAQAVDDLAWARYSGTRKMYLGIMSFPPQLPPANTWYYPVGPFTTVHDLDQDYGDLIETFPTLDTTNGFIHVPEDGFYEVETRIWFMPGFSGSTPTRQMWSGGWQDETNRGRHSKTKGHQATDIEPGFDPNEMLQHSVVAPFRAGQTVRSFVWLQGGTVGVTGTLRMLGPFQRSFRS